MSEVPEETPVVLQYSEMFKKNHHFKNKKWTTGKLVLPYVHDMDGTKG